MTTEENGCLSCQRLRHSVLDMVHQISVLKGQNLRLRRKLTADDLAVSAERATAMRLLEDVSRYGRREA